MLKPLLFSTLLLALVPQQLSLKPAQEPTAAAPTAAPTAVSTPAGTKNPIKATSESKAKAKKMYTYDCEMCHNANGDGKSDLAKDMTLSLTDLTDPKTLADKSDAELFDLIKNGKGKMPPEDTTRAKPDDIWNLVLYVRGLAKPS